MGESGNMSERRMFSKSITESDAFLELSFAAQTLYFHMAMNADDEGFVNSSRRICGMCGVDEKALAELVEKGFLIRFNSGIYVIKHWKINNKIRGDRIKDTNYPEEKAQIIEKSNGVYSLKNAEVETRVETVEKTEADNKPGDEVVKGNLTTEIVREEEPEEPREQFDYETQSEQRKNYAEQVFDILFSHGLPCCNGNLITFTMRDFKLAASALNSLHLHSDEVIAAVKNYAQVIELKRQGLTWWNSEQTFYNFCEKKTILKFLPENFRIEDFKKQKEAESSPVEDKIQL